MPTLEQVQEQISKIENADTFGTKKEIRYLPEILQADERIKGLTSGNMDGHTWLIVCTNKRVIFLDKGLIYGLKQLETPLEKINSIEHRTGLIFGEIGIWDGSSKMIIKHLLKKSVKPFVNALNIELDNLRSQRSGQTPGRFTDIADQIKKLAELKNQGVLTDEEFQMQKQKLLTA